MAIEKTHEEQADTSESENGTTRKVLGEEIQATLLLPESDDEYGNYEQEPEAENTAEMHPSRGNRTEDLPPTLPLDSQMDEEEQEGEEHEKEQNNFETLQNKDANLSLSPGQQQTQIIEYGDQEIQPTLELPDVADEEYNQEGEDSQHSGHNLYPGSTNQYDNVITQPIDDEYDYGGYDNQQQDTMVPESNQVEEEEGEKETHMENNEKERDDEDEEAAEPEEPEILDEIMSPREESTVDQDKTTGVEFRKPESRVISRDFLTNEYNTDMQGEEYEREEAYHLEQAQGTLTETSRNSDNISLVDSGKKTVEVLNSQNDNLTTLPVPNDDDDEDDVQATLSLPEHKEGEYHDDGYHFNDHEDINGPKDLYDQGHQFEQRHQEERRDLDEEEHLDQSEHVNELGVLNNGGEEVHTQLLDSQDGRRGESELQSERGISHPGTEPPSANKDLVRNLENDMNDAVFNQQLTTKDEVKDENISQKATGSSDRQQGVEPLASDINNETTNSSSGEFGGFFRGMDAREEKRLPPIKLPVFERLGSLMNNPSDSQPNEDFESLAAFAYLNTAGNSNNAERKPDSEEAAHGMDIEDDDTNSPVKKSLVNENNFVSELKNPIERPEMPSEKYLLANSNEAMDEEQHNNKKEQPVLNEASGETENKRVSVKVNRPNQQNVEEEAIKKKKSPEKKDEQSDITKEGFSEAPTRSKEDQALHAKGSEWNQIGELDPSLAKEYRRDSSKVFTGENLLGGNKEIITTQDTTQSEPVNRMKKAFVSKKENQANQDKVLDESKVGRLDENLAKEYQRQGSKTSPSNQESRDMRSDGKDKQTKKTSVPKIDSQKPPSKTLAQDKVGRIETNTQKESGGDSSKELMKEKSDVVKSKDKIASTQNSTQEMLGNGLPTRKSFIKVAQKPTQEPDKQSPQKSKVSFQHSGITGNAAKIVESDKGEVPSIPPMSAHDFLKQRQQKAQEVQSAQKAKEAVKIKKVQETQEAVQKVQEATRKAQEAREARRIREAKIIQEAEEALRSFELQERSSKKSIETKKPSLTKEARPTQKSISPQKPESGAKSPVQAQKSPLKTHEKTSLSKGPEPKMNAQENSNPKNSKTKMEKVADDEQESLVLHYGKTSGRKESLARSDDESREEESLESRQEVLARKRREREEEVRKIEEKHNEERNRRNKKSQSTAKKVLIEEADPEIKEIETTKPHTRGRRPSKDVDTEPRRMVTRSRSAKTVESDVTTPAVSRSRSTSKKKTEEAKDGEIVSVKTRSRTPVKMDIEDDDEEAEGEEEIQTPKKKVAVQGRGRANTRQSNQKMKKNNSKAKISVKEEHFDDKRPASGRSTRARSRRSSEKPVLDDYEKAATTTKKRVLNGKASKAVRENQSSPRKQTKGKGKKKGTGTKKLKEETEISEEESDENEEVKEEILPRHAYKVMFSGFEKDDQEVEDSKEVLAKYGAKVVEEKDQNFNVLVMDVFKRTIKFLLAVAKGVDIVNYKWVQECLDAKTLLDPVDYIYYDRKIEFKYNFRLDKSLEVAKSRKTGLLEGFRVYVPPNIKPKQDEIKVLIECIGGIVVKTKPAAFREDCIIILNEDDERNIEHFKELEYQPYTTELIYSAVLQQKLELKQNKL